MRQRNRDCWLATVCLAAEFLAVSGCGGTAVERETLAPERAPRADTDPSPEITDRNGPAAHRAEETPGADGSATGPRRLKTAQRPLLCPQQRTRWCSAIPSTSGPPLPWSAKTNPYRTSQCFGSSSTMEVTRAGRALRFCAGICLRCCGANRHFPVTKYAHPEQYPLS